MEFVKFTSLRKKCFQETNFFLIKENFDVNIVFFRAYYAKNIRICLIETNKSKQIYVWNEPIFEAQNICFFLEIAGLLETFLS